MHDERSCRRSLVLIALTGASLGLAGAAAAQERAISGIVLHEQSLRPLSGVQVVVEGSERGALTDAQGRFSISGLSGTEATLRFVMLGYRLVTRTVPVGTADLRVLLSETAIELNEIVVTGVPGATQRRAIGNSIATVDAADALALSGASAVSTVINGRAPGVIITPGTGRVGTGPSINIRGRSTISLSQQPLVYIDGVRVNNEIGTGPRGSTGLAAISRLNDINPQDIASIEIIKGPAAATIYGTEASNGVIQIITKKGQTDTGPRFTATIRQGTSWFQNIAERLPTNYALHPETGELLTFNAVKYENERGRDLYEAGRLQKYALSVRGGTDLIRYYLSMAYDKQDGVEPGNGLNRFTGHVNLGLTATESLDIQTSLNINKGRTYLGEGSGASILFGALLGNPLFEALDFPAGPYLAYSPEVYRELFESWQDLARFTASVQVNHRPTPWFQQRLTVGLDQTGEDNQFLIEFAPPELAPQFASPSDARGQLLQDLRNVAYYTADYSGTVTLPITRDLTSTSSVGAQYYRRRTDFTNITASEFPAPGLRTAEAAARVTGTQDYVTNSTLGLYVQQRFGWHDRLFLTGAVRVDNNSAFGQEIDFVTYPKVSGAWVISEAPFWELSWVDQLRLRAAYGASGQQPEAFAALRTFTPATGLDDLPVVVPGSVGNLDLKPERGQELEVGFELGLLERFGVNFTYFTKTIRDAILERNIAPSSGFSGSRFVNIGEISNHGFEVIVDAQAISRPDFAWDLTASLATAEDRIEDLGGIPFIPLDLPTQRHVEGYPIGGFFTKQIVSAELNEAGQAIDIVCDDGAGGAVDCAQAPALFMGTPTPTYNGSVATTLTLWNRLRLHGLVSFSGGHELFNTNHFIRCSLLKVCEENVNPGNVDATFIAATQIGGDFSAVAPFIENGAHARLREISASYALPETWLDRIGVSAASITLAGRNLHTWTDYTGLDPESRGIIDNAVVSYDQAVLPVMPQLITSLRVSF